MGVLLGNLARDSELRYTTTGIPVGEFLTVAQPRYPLRDEIKEDVYFIDIVATRRR